MCFCEKPTINGKTEYRWNNSAAPASIYPLNPPDVENEDTILFDEPGRCGGIDSHSFHYRLIESKHGEICLIVRHGGGDERTPRLSNSRAVVEALTMFDSNGRYWVMNALYHAQSDAARKAREIERIIWQKAAAEKRIKTRKNPSKGSVKVWIDSVVK